MEARIRTIHDSDNTLGAPRSIAELNDQPAQTSEQTSEQTLERIVERVNHKRVTRTARIVGSRKRRLVWTTVPEPADEVVLDLLKRDFTAEQPNRRYVGDITYCRSLTAPTCTWLR